MYLLKIKIYAVTFPLRKGLLLAIFYVQNIYNKQVQFINYYRPWCNDIIFKTLQVAAKMTIEINFEFYLDVILIQFSL